MEGKKVWEKKEIISQVVTLKQVAMINLEKKEFCSLVKFNF